MKRSLAMGATSAGRSLRVLVTSAMLLAALTVTNVVISPSGAMAAISVRHGGAGQLFYTTSGAGTGLPCRARRMSRPVGLRSSVYSRMMPTRGFA